MEHFLNEYDRLRARLPDRMDDALRAVDRDQPGRAPDARFVVVVAAAWVGALLSAIALY